MGQAILFGLLYTLPFYLFNPFFTYLHPRPVTTKLIQTYSIPAGTFHVCIPSSFLAELLTDNVAPDVACAKIVVDNSEDGMGAW